MEGVLSKRPKHAAPGQYLGFAIQPVRLCYHLLTCPAKARVSLELLDDIAIHYADGSVLLEQAKSALSQNPLSDWAVDLWKCIANWLAALDKGFVTSGTTQFRLYVTPVRGGDLSTALTDAQTSTQVENIAASVQSRLAKMKKPPISLQYIQAFIDATPEARLSIIGQFAADSSDVDPVDPIRELISPTVDPNLVDSLCAFAIGRAKESADGLIRSGQPAILDGDSFKSEFRHFVQKNNLPGFLTSLTPPPPDGEVSALLATRPIFVKQLEFIDVTEDERVRAVSDFLRASADKSSWAEAGLVFQNEWKEWNGELTRRHGLIRGEVSDVHAEKPATIRGRITYRQCAQMQPQLEGRAVASHFIHGCLNDLADSKTIGWHPDYVELLKGEVK